MTEIYRDPTKPVADRVKDLMDRMSLEDKVGQMIQVNGQHEPERMLEEKRVGSFLHVMGDVTIALQRLASATRLGIPLLFGIDAIHGHAFWPNATVFPTQLGLACSWNTDLIKQVGQITALEASLTGMHWTFSPVLGTARDLRWGRIDETFGEDPYLAGVLGTALIQGHQGERLDDPHTILACAKHYAGYPGTRGGRDASEADLTRRGMLSVFLPPFEKAIRAGCATVMTAYQAIDGVPCTANRWLLHDVLREEWRFDGFVVTDWDNVGRMHDEQKVYADMEGAVKAAAESGNDMIMSTPEFYDVAINLVRDGRLDISYIDRACRRILELKFKLGLFDQNRYPPLAEGQDVIGCQSHREKALEAAYQSIVLLKNDYNILPLTDDAKRIAVIGPNADDIEAQLGDWVSWSGQLGAGALPRARASVVTVLDGIRTRVGQETTVEYVRGCDILNPEEQEIDRAVVAAGRADVAIVVVGDGLKQTGETRDRANLDLSGSQQALVEAVYATRVPMIVVLINSKPLTIPWIAEHVPAIVEAWNPGLEGGTAMAGILFGDRSPSGKLTISFPHHVGQQPVYYNQVPGWHGEQEYIDMPRDALFAFGYGQSYTHFDYSDLRVENPSLVADETLRVSVLLENGGPRAGTETVQLYVNDTYSSVTTPSRELKAFKRVYLEPGESERVHLEVAYDSLALVRTDLERIVEPGTFEVMVGSSSRDQDLLKSTFQVKAQE